MRVEKHHTIDGAIVDSEFHKKVGNTVVEIWASHNTFSYITINGDVVGHIESDSSDCSFTIEEYKDDSKS